jgi:TatD DNase family protein
MLVRSRRAGVVSMIITGGSLSESKLALDIAKEYSTCRGSLCSRWQFKLCTDLYATIGCHPTRSKEFEKDPSGYFHALDELVRANLSGPGRVVAIGECGLDYDRTHFASPVIQQKHFRGCDLINHLKSY